MNNYLQRLIFTIRDKWMLFGSISLGLFLFILFFQPLPNRFRDLDNILIFNAGFGVIAMILLYISHLLSKIFGQQDKVVLSYFNGFIFFLLCSVAFTFYLRFVGGSIITFYSVLKIVLLCLTPPVVLRIYLVIHDLGLQQDLLRKENTALHKQLHNITSVTLPLTIEFQSTENATETLKFNLSDIILFNSADNYVEICYTDKNTIRKKLVRHTLTSIEHQLKPYERFVRCHRTCIINTSFIEKVHFKVNACYVLVKDLKERIPVSRQYMLKLKEALAALQG